MLAYRAPGRLLLLVVMSFFLFNIQSRAQISPGNKKINLVLKNTTLKEGLLSIQEQSGIHFLFSGEFDKYAPQKVNTNEKGITVKAAIELLLKNTNLRYTWVDDQVVIDEKPAEYKRKSPSAPTSKPGQQTTQPQNISGRVMELSSLQPLHGASVRIRNSSQGTSTDSTGAFYFSNIPDNAVLVVSMVGYDPIEIGIIQASNGYTASTLDKTVSGNITVMQGRNLRIGIKLTPSSSQLDETIVIGYGKQKKALMTSAVGSFKPKDEDIRQVSSPTRLLEGRIAGVSASIGSGNLASGERISIRGISSITAGNTPLYVVDGVPINNSNMGLYDFGETYSPLASLNHADIESIEILKDAASASIYGSRASNGVILITTKSGKTGKTTVRADISTGFSEFADKNKLKVANSDLYVLQYNEGQENYNKQYGLSVGKANYKMPISNPFGDMPDTDWLGLILQKGYFKNINTSLSGGTANSQFYLSLGYTDQDGVVKNNSLKKYNINAKINHKFADWLEIGASNMGNYIRNNQVPGANLGSTIIARAIEQRPFDRPYKPNGNYYVGGTDELTRHNPVQILNEQVAYVDNFRYLGTFFGKLNFTKNLSFKSSYSADIGYTYDYTYYNANHPYGTGVGRLLDYNRLIQNYLSEQVLTYNNKFNDLDVTALAGYSFQKQHIRNSNIDARGFATPSLAVVSVASEIFEAGGAPSEYALESYFSRGTLTYKDKYMFSATLRTDGSSKFSSDNRWGVFPSVSFGWNVSKEKFLQQSGIDMKLRASFGKTGNQEGIGSYAYLATMSGGQNYGHEGGISASSFGNQNLTWEKADQYDLGFDLSLFRRKVDITFDAYYKKTTDLLYSMPVHATTGMTSIITNIGSMENRGVELSISTNFNLGPVKWTSSFNIAHNQNKILSLLGDDKPIAIGDNRALQVGRDIGSFYLFQMEGLYQYDGEVPNQQFDLGVRAGDVKWTDVDGNKIINDNDRVVTGSSNPKFFGGWNNSFRFKNFQLDILATYMYGNDIYAAWKPNGMARVGYRFAQLEEYVVNRWTGPGTTNIYPRAIASETFNTRNSTRFLEDGSFIRLRAVTLSYQFPKLVLGKLNLDGLRVYAQADNLFLFTKYSGWDPEVNSNLDPRYFGVDLFNNPQPRTYSVGVNINFLKK